MSEKFVFPFFFRKLSIKLFALHHFPHSAALDKRN